MTHLVNDLDAVVTEAVDALVRASGGALARLDGYPFRRTGPAHRCRVR